MNKSECRKKYLSVDKNMEPSQLDYLFDLSSTIENGCIVEIGSWRGGSTIALALGTIFSEKYIPVYAIDPHNFRDSYPPNHWFWTNKNAQKCLKVNEPVRTKFMENVINTGTAEVIRLINLRSEDVCWKKEISLLFIDGDHEYEGVKRDFENYEPFVKVGGYVVLHDTSAFTGPKKLLSEIAERFELPERQVHNMTVLIKRGEK